jgi:hypothetical protein
MILWKGSGYDGSDALLIGAVAGGHRITLQLRATPLAGSPITVSGTMLAPGGVTVAQIRAGGLTIVLSVSWCVARLAPCVGVAVIALCCSCRVPFISFNHSRAWYVSPACLSAVTASPTLR